MNVTISRAHQALVVPPTPGVLTMFQACPKLPDGNIVVPHGLRETLLLRHAGFTVPNPIMYYYDWCGGKPFAVQKRTCQMLTENRRAYVLNHMGTGKTKAALWAWDYMNKCGLVNKLLVVAPLSTLKFVWASEAFATMPRRKVAVLHGTKAQRLERLEEDADIFVINHDGLKVIEKELSARTDIDALVLDELAVYRNNSDRSKKMRKFAQRFTVAWGLTGAPMPNSPVDVWAQCMILTPDRVPRFQAHIRHLLMLQVSPYVWKPKADAVQQAYAFMQPSVRFALDDVVELPPLVSRTIDVPMSPSQEKVYKKVASAMKAMVGDKTITAANAGVAMGKLLQIAGGWVYTNNPETVRLDPTPRVMALYDMITSAEHKVLVVVPYRNALEGISKIFSMDNVNLDHVVVHGDIHDRENIFNLFQNTDKYKAMLVDPRCVSHGLTLTAADTVIWYLPITSLETYDQFNARVTRVGQKHKQQLLHLQSTPIERKVYKMLREHQKMQSMFLQLVEEATADAT